MPLTIIQNMIISDQLEKENASEFVETLILKYANDTENASHLLALIPKIAETQLQIAKTHITEYSTATTLLIGDCTKLKDINFYTMLYTGKVYFPSGNCDGASPYGKEFFYRFIEKLKIKTTFNYESVGDWDFICSVADCEQWMLSVIRQNIDPNFKM